MDTARDWTIGGKLGLHLINTAERVVLADIVLGEVNGPAVVHTIFSLCWRRPGAVTAEINGFTLAINQVVGSILLAR
jgi:hypothetical protein